ncbi:MAG: class I SAM-dependent methyltransferase [Deltaproteobacteria bacterium]
MGKLLNIVTPLHQATMRDYLARMLDDKVHCMQVAKQYGKEYWDDDRRYGYGGYRYIPGRWKPVAEALIDTYGLTNESSVLDVGCGKAFLLYEMRLILPGLRIAGFDISAYGIECAHSEIKNHLFIHKAEDPYPFSDKEFDLVISLGCLHNLKLSGLKSAITEIQRVGKNGYIMLESYRDEQELFNLQCWALTCEMFMDKGEWALFYKDAGYSGDYEFIYFE